MKVIKIGTTYTLTQEQQKECIELAKKRTRINRFVGITQRIFTDLPSKMELLGIGGEHAFCSLFDVEPDTSSYLRSSEFETDTNDAILPCGLTVDVKSTKYKMGRLQAALRKSPTGDLYALMTGTFPTFTFRGFMPQKELIKESRIGDLGHGQLYLAEQDELKELEHISEAVN